MEPVGLEIRLDFGGKCLLYSVIDEEAFDDTETLFIIDLFSRRLEYQLNHLFEEIGEY